LDPKTNKYLDIASILSMAGTKSSGGAGGGGFNGQMQGYTSNGNGLVEATAGTATQMPDYGCTRVIIQANPDNAGDIVIGGSNVVATTALRNGITLYASQSQEFKVSNVSQLWIDTTNTGDKISYYYEK
jgi:hypothetical protein